MKKWKRALYLALALLLCLSLCACKQSQTSSEPSEKPSASASAPDASAPQETAETKPSEPASSGESYVLKFSANDPADSTYDKLVIQILQQKLEEKSNGRLALEVYYSSSLAKQGECLDAIKNGTVDMGVDIPAMYPGQFLYTELFGSPGINLGNAEEVTYTMAAYMEAFPESGMEDFKIICRFSSGTFGLLSADKPITKVSDLAGMSVRASRQLMPWYEAMGASATFIPMGDLYESLKLSVIDGAPTTVGGTYAFGLQEVANYFTPLTMMNGDQVIAMSRALYDEMPADLQAVIDEVAAEMTDVAISYVFASEEETMNNIFDSNPDFKFLELEDVQGFLDAATAVLEDKAKELDDMGLDGSGALEWLREHEVS
jgi:TRAP-type C4-dicarboxylate transport system substrate-binding protein